MNSIKYTLNVVEQMYNESGELKTIVCDIKRLNPTGESLGVKRITKNTIDNKVESTLEELTNN